MLFGYPEDALAENDIHDRIVAYIEAGIVALDAGEAAPDFKTFMPENPPELRRKTTLKRAFRELWNILEKKNPAYREVVRNAIQSQGNLPEILRNSEGCPGPVAIPDEVRETVGNIFKAGFELLSATGVRDRLWDKVWKAQGDKCFCAFCGLEQFETSPSANRPDLDHYLASMRYEAARANLKNLAPMGGECNRNFKNTQDVIFDQHGTRRAAFYPYDALDTPISLAGSQLLPSEGKPEPSWKITLGSTPEAETWDSVFKIRERYEYLILRGRNAWWRSLAETVHAEASDWNPSNVHSTLTKFRKSLCSSERPAERKLQEQQLMLILEELEGHPNDASIMAGILKDLAPVPH